MEIPETRYARSGDVNIAYQVFGAGALDLVYVPGWVSHVEETWDDPEHAAMLRRLCSFARVIVFGKRSTGLSARGRIDLSGVGPGASAELSERLGRYMRHSASPGAAAALLRMNTQIDVRDVLPTIRVPTLMLQRVRDRDVHIDEARWIASRIPSAR